MEPIFTFIIPSIRKDSLAYAIDSALYQTIKDFKIIVCGDGVQIPPVDDEKILTIIAPRRGDQSQTRNYAAKYVTTPWVVFLDDDDWVSPDYLENFIPYLDTSDIVISQMNNYGTIMPVGNIISHGNVGISFAVRTNILLRKPLPPPPSEDYVYLKNMEIEGFRISYTNRCGYFVRKFLIDPDFKPIQ